MTEAIERPPNSIDALSDEVTALAERDALTADDLALLLTRIDAGMKRLREVKADLEKFLIGWLPTHDGELVIGDMKYFVAPDRKVKDRNVAATIRGLMEAVGGDEEAFLECLSKNSVKPGAARKVLGDRFDEFFETTYGDKLESKLQSVNTRFLK